MNKSETVTENIFRDFYGAKTFIEKSAIPSTYGFVSKKGTSFKGYPDFFKDKLEYAIIVEAKADDIKSAETEVIFYMDNNKINKDLIGIAVSGQDINSLDVSYFYKIKDTNQVKRFNVKNVLLSIESLNREFLICKYGESISTENLIQVLKELNKKFNNENKIRDTDRSLFFSGLMIALTNNNFRNTYKNILAPSENEISSTSAAVLESHNLNEAILNAITKQLESKINNLSKEYSWRDKFSFIKNIDYSLNEYKEIIEIIETKIFKPFLNGEKQDILGRAYKIFLSRAGKVDNKNIILTPDHIKKLMVKLARLSKDDVVLDTCTGSGGFLMEAMENMIEKAEGNPEKILNIKEHQLIGFEIDSVLFALACSNMFLHGDGRTNLLYRSSLLNDCEGKIVNSSDKQLFDYIKEFKPSKVIINPPYENNNAIKFTKQAIDYLEPNGKLIIIMPTPTLTHNQNGMTEKILKEAKLDFVIKMPFNLFTEQKRTVNTSIFGFTKTPHNEIDDVLFYNLEDDGLVSIQHKGRVDKNNQWSKIESEIINCIFNCAELDGKCKKMKIFKDGIINCAGFQEKNNSSYEMVKMSDLFLFIGKGTLASEQADESGEYDFITASEEWKKHNEYDREEEAIVYAISASGSLGRAHYVNGKYIASNLCYILKEKDNPKYKINMKFYSYYLNSIRKQVVSDLADGTSKLTLSPDELKKYYINYIPYDEQIKFLKEYIDKYNIIEKEYKKAKEQLELNMIEKF